MLKRETGRPSVVMTIAGSDSGGGAGIQADLKTIASLGGYGCTVITALTAQNSMGVQAIHPVPTEFIAAQLDSVLPDFRPEAAKTGMLATQEIIEAVAGKLTEAKLKKLVVDPVMVSTTGHRLLDSGAEEALKKEMFPLALLVTPNLHEASALTGEEIGEESRMADAARRLVDMGARAVLLKGGHLSGGARDYYREGERGEFIDGERIETTHTHGSGCVLAAAIATYLAMGFSTYEAVRSGKAFITRAIRGAVGIGKGPGPVDPMMGPSTEGMING